MDGTTAPVEQERGPEQIAQLEGKDSSGLFFPGAFRLPEPGTWRITVEIGGDTGCFLVSTSD